MVKRRGGYPSFGGGSNMNKMVKQMKKLQKQMEEAQSKLDETIFEATAGGGAIKAEMNGKKELLKIEIKPEILDPEDVEMLQDMILLVVNDCIKQVEDQSESQMSQLSGGLNIPGIM